MSNVEIEVFNIARTVVDREAVQRWLDYLGADEFVLPDPEELSDPALLVALAAKRCYNSWQPGLNPNLTKVRADMVEFLDNLLKQQHGSVLEHSVYSFAIEGISRVCTGELNRHRAGWAVSEGSMRFIRFDKDIRWWLPHSIRPNTGRALYDWDDLDTRKYRTREVFRRAFDQMGVNYAELLKIWEMDEKDKNFSYKKKMTSLFRRIIGMGVATGGVWTGNLRALRHVIAMRATEAAEEEISYVFGEKIGPYMIEKEKELFGDFEGSSALVPKYWKV